MMMIVVAAVEDVMASEPQAKERSWIYCRESRKARELSMFK